MKCHICGKSDEDVPLFKGISKEELIMVCSDCARREGIPLITRPSEEQLEKAEVHYSVRERMERLSGLKKDTKEAQNRKKFIVPENLAKLRMPKPKEYNEEVLDDYYWRLTIARRRKKLSTSQLGRMTGLSADLIRQIERGTIPENFREVFTTLENALGIRLLKARRIDLKITKEDEEKILEEVRKKLEGGEPVEDGLEKNEALEKISKGELDFSKRENLQNITLSDLVEIKKARERKESLLKKREKEESLIGEEIDLEEDF